MQNDPEKEYYETKLGGATLRLFWNDYRKTEKDPILICYVSQTPKEGQTRPTQQRGQVAPQKSRITPKPQPQAQQQAYVDHTQGRYGTDPRDPNVPWPDESDMPF
jgi:hypothetical protein